MRISSFLRLATLFVLAAGCGDSGNGGPSGFAEFPWAVREPDVRTERLCREAADPDHAPDTTFVDCQVEGASFARRPPAAQREITVLAYNIERGFQIDRQLDLILAGDAMPVPDIILLSEADRGCRRTDFRNITRDYARALGYYYVYATEFVELPSDRGMSGPYDPPLCEHGNAIVSRFPLGNVRQIRHAANRSWYTPPNHPNPDEPRLGGRVAIAADAKIGDTLVRLYSLHLESTLSVLRIRDAQAVEIGDDAATVDRPVIVGGDLNSYFAFLDFMNGSRNDGPTQAFLTRGFTDSHAGLPIDDRYTSFDAGSLIIDFLFARGMTVIDAGVCERSVCGSLSDHLPVWTTLRLD